MKLESWQRIGARIAPKVKKTELYLKETKYYLKQFLKTVEEMDEEFNILKKLPSGLSNKRVSDILVIMPTWPEEIQTKAEMLLQILGSEYDKVIDSFPSELVNHIEKIQEDLYQIVHGHTYKSLEILKEKINSIVKTMTSSSKFSKSEDLVDIQGILDNVIARIKSAQFYANAEEKIIEKEHIIMQALLGDKYLRDNASLFRQALLKIAHDEFTKKRLELLRKGCDDHPIPEVIDIQTKMIPYEVGSYHFKHVIIPQMNREMLLIHININLPKTDPQDVWAPSSKEVIIILKISYVPDKDIFFCEVKSKRKGRNFDNVDYDEEKDLGGHAYDNIEEIFENLTKIVPFLNYYN